MHSGEPAPGLGKGHQGLLELEHPLDRGRDLSTTAVLVWAITMAGSHEPASTILRIVDIQ